MIESYYVTYKNSEVHYLKFGSGTSYVVCFHGYGEDASSFLFLQSSLEKDYTFIAVDLPFHGKTVWNESLLLEPSSLVQIIGKIIPLDFQKVSLLGYSMGGRVALHLMEIIPGKIERAVLIAPDGLHKNFWYWFSTQTAAGNSLFSRAMQKPKLMFWLMRLGKNAGLLNKSIFKFAHAYLDDAHERDVLYKRWTTMKLFKPKLRLLTSLIKEHSIQLRMIFGSYDRVILVKRSERLSKSKSFVRVKVIKAGHQLLKDKYAKDIAALFVE